jgi:hypothetical protein
LGVLNRCFLACFEDLMVAQADEDGGIVMVADPLETAHHGFAGATGSRLEAPSMALIVSVTRCPGGDALTG